MSHDFSAGARAGNGGRDWSVATGTLDGWVAPRCPWRGGAPRPTPRFRTWDRALSVGLLITGFVMAGAGTVGAAETPKAPANAAVQQAPREPTPSDPPAVELTFGAPKRFAIITELGGKRQRLYAVGDSLADPLEPSRTVQIQQIEPKRLRLRDSHTQRVLWIAEGALVPGFPNRRFTGTAALRGLDHRYVTTVAPLDPEPRLLGIQGDRALLEVDIHPPQPLVARAPRQGERPSGLPSPGPPSPQPPDLAPFERVRVKETAPDTYEISSAELRDALDHGGRVLAEEWPQVAPLLSIRDGVRLQVKSPVAEGILSSRGFQVTSANLAGRAGIEVGDVILAINGQAVNSFADLFNLYLAAVRNPRLSDVEVNLERKGAPLTKTYRVR
jgi:hypothetical protein